MVKWIVEFNDGKSAVMLLSECNTLDEAIEVAELRFGRNKIKCVHR